MFNYLNCTKYLLVHKHGGNGAISFKFSPGGVLIQDSASGYGSLRDFLVDLGRLYMKIKYDILKIKYTNLVG